MHTYTQEHTCASTALFKHAEERYFIQIDEQSLKCLAFCIQYSDSGW